MEVKTEIKMNENKKCNNGKSKESIQTMRHLRKNEKCAQALTLLISIREVTGLNIGQNISCPQMFRGFS